VIEPERGSDITEKYFAAVALGGTWQVVSAPVSGLFAIPDCGEVVMVKQEEIAAQLHVRNVVYGMRRCTGLNRAVADPEIMSQLIST
jgi:hypothetical protein